MQLWALGRAADPNVLKKEGGYDLVSASDLPMDKDAPVPRPLKVEEIKEYVKEFATAADNAVHKAGFDGVEVHFSSSCIVFLALITDEDTCCEWVPSGPVLADRLERPHR